MTEGQRRFLARFVARGWLHGTRDDPAEQDAVDAGLAAGWLRRELGEVHFTPAGRQGIDRALCLDCSVELGDDDEEYGGRCYRCGEAALEAFEETRRQKIAERNEY